MWFLKSERKLPGLRTLKEAANRRGIERNAALPEFCGDRRPRRPFFSQPPNLVQIWPEQALERLRMIVLRRYPVILTGKSNTSKGNTKVRITSKGQVTIPQELRERFGLLPNTEVEFVATPDGKELRLLKSSKPSGRGRALIERMRGQGTGKLSTDELLKLMRSDV